MSDETVVQTKPFAVTLDAGTSLLNKTGTWRTHRPVYVDRLPPCNNACPAGENIQAWLFEAEEGNYEAAIDYFQRSLDIFQRIGFQRGVGIVLKNLGFTYLHLGDARAIETFCTVLISAHGVHDVLLETIVGFAWLRYQQDQIASAAELVGLVRHHPAYNQDLQHRLDGLLPRLEATLNLDKLSAAMERGKNLDLDRVVQDLLREFGEEATAVLPGQNNKESDD